MREIDTLDTLDKLSLIVVLVSERKEEYIKVT